MALDKAPNYTLVAAFAIDLGLRAIVIDVLLNVVTLNIF